jgi:uncharacterized membrane protein
LQGDVSLQVNVETLQTVLIVKFIGAGGGSIVTEAVFDASDSVLPLTPLIKKLYIPVG